MPTWAETLIRVAVVVGVGLVATRLALSVVNRFVSRVEASDEAVGLRTTVLRALDEKGIAIPYPHREIVLRDADPATATG